MPGLISLKPGECKGLLHMEQKIAAFGRGTIRALVHNPAIVAPSLELAAMARTGERRSPTGRR